MKKIFIVLLTQLILITHFSAQTIPSYVPANGLIGWWPFNSNANDESGNGNHGKVNGATLTEDRNNLANNAYNFDGNSQSIQIPFTSRMSSKKISISFWVNIPQNYQGNNEFGFIVRSRFFGYEVIYLNSDKSLSFVLHHDYNNKSTQAKSIKQEYNDQKWRNVICTFDGTYNKLYIDGELAAIDTSDVNEIYYQSDGVISFGKDGNNSSPYTAHFNGKIDDVGIWDRALTENEINDLFKARGCSEAPISPVIGTITQPTCAMPTGSVILSGLPTGNWSINPGNITGNTSSHTITGLAPSATYNFTVTNTATGCISTATSNVDINAILAPTKGATISVAANGPFCVNGTGIFTVIGGESNGSVKYKLDNGTEQTQPLDNLGGATINVGNIVASKSIVLTSILTSTNCSSSITSASATATITVNPISTSESSIEVQGNGPICRTDNAIFKIVKGQPNETVTYTVNGVESSIILNNLGEKLIDLGIVSSNITVILNKITTTTGCESAITSLKKSTSIEINLPNVPVADISQIICAVDNKQLKDIKFTAPQNNQNGAFIFRYKFDPVLASLPINTFIKDTTYIVKYNDGQCESDEISLTIKTNKGGNVQNGSFNSCAIEEPLVGQLIPNGTNISWYSTSNSGGKLDKLTTKLSNGVYYYSSKNAQGCESVTRGEVVVTLNKGSNPFPSLNPSLVVPIEFCLSANPQIADLSSKIESQLTGQNVFANKMVWYLSATDKVAYNGKLDDLKSYFVTYVDASSCESIDRFEVPVKLKDFQGITTMNLDQSFCKENSVVINDIDFTPNIYSDFEIKNELGELVTDKYQKLTTQFYELRLIDKSNLLNCVSSKTSKLKISISESNLIKVQPIASLILKNSNEILLSATPKGGTFSGEGVKGNYFYPYQCKLGTKKITYNYKTQNSKCDGSASIITIIVDSTENKCHIYDTVKVTKYDTIKTFTSVTDTLKIKLKLTTGTFSKQYNNIKIYPNPTISDVMIDYGNYKTMQGYYLTISDINGKKLNILPINQQITKIDLSSFGGPGMYFFNFHDINSNIIETKKIVLE